MIRQTLKILSLPDHFGISCIKRLSTTHWPVFYAGRTFPVKINQSFINYKHFCRLSIYLKKYLRVHEFIDTYRSETMRAETNIQTPKFCL